MFTQVRRMQYLSSSNSPVAVRIGNHTRKGKALILLVDKFLLPLSHFNLLTTADSAIPLYTCSRINLVTENNGSDTLITMWRLSLLYVTVSVKTLHVSIFCIALQKGI